MGTIITIAILAVGGFFVYKYVVQPQMANAGKGGAEALAEFDENKEKLIEEYFADENRFGLFKKVIADEQIKGFTSAVAPTSVGKVLGEELKTSITGVKKVNMDLYYLVVTDKNLHHLESNGDNIIDHTVFSLDNIEGVTIAKAGGLNLKDQMTGMTGDVDKMKFTYKGKEYNYNLYRAVIGFPRFKAVKDAISGQYGHTFYYNASGQSSGFGFTLTKEMQIDYFVKNSFYESFKAELAAKLNAQFPA